MAASPPSAVRMKTTDEEMNSAMETEECSATKNGGEPENRDVHTGEPETGDIFKKPALFAAPSLTSKRSGVAAPSKPSAAETKTVTEDDCKRSQDEIQKLTDKFVAKCDEKYHAKEKEIMDI